MVNTENEYSIDIIIPTFRLEEKALLTIINLPKPADFTTHFYIVADNPLITIPKSLLNLHEANQITLLINAKNEGVPATRNRGIRAGKSKWILFLDDDVKPQEDLLLAYAEAIQKQNNAIGFVGVTNFPEPFNAVTTALIISGFVSHFSIAKEQDSLVWAPTANIILNRQKLNEPLFDPALTISGEDVDFLARNSLQFNEKYLSVPKAVALHPWWNNGAAQTNRMFRYGVGASQMAAKEPVKSYTYRDFTNTVESILLLILLLPVALYTGSTHVVVVLLVAIIGLEFIMSWFRAISVGKTWSLAVAFQLVWTKNCYQFGYLVNSLKQGRISGFAERIELGFIKPHPSSFRLNRWKIARLVLLLSLVIFLLFF